MFKRFIGKVAELKSSNASPQNHSSWSSFSTISSSHSEMEDSQFCIDDDIEETPENSPARVTVSESITKENLYAAYKKLHGRYHNYKMKYTEIANNFKQTVTTHDKDKINMTKAQDKLLQRIAELKQQCTLEQAAKIHMEDALRNDIEERDHIISTLNTKIDLLWKNSSNECESTPSVDSIHLLAKCERLNEELTSTKIECESLEKQIELLKKIEDSSLLSIAENKMAIHKELETKENQIQKLEKTINGLQMENKILLKENAGHSSINSYQVNIDQNVQEEILKQLKEFEGEMYSAFELKENELKELRNYVKVLEQRFKSQKKTNISTEEILQTKKKEIKDLKFVISRLQQNIYDAKISHSKEVDTFLKEMDKLKQNNQKSENELLDLQKEICQIRAVMKVNDQNHVNECNRYISESHCKSQDINTLKKEIELLNYTIEENEQKYKDQQNKVDDAISHSIKVDTFLKEMDKLKENNQKSENELLDLQKEICQIRAVMKENDQNHVNECNRYISESHCKLQDINTLKKEIELLNYTIEENEQKYKDQQNKVDDTISHSMKVNTFLKEIGEKSQIIKWTNKLEDEVKHRNTDEDDDNDKGGCQIEYLRNVLYEYLMGKQTMVLVKVLAAIVKFDSNQLKAVLQKEEQKVSLLKTAGL